ncbi:MAG: hypothetical protein ACREDI_11180 [Roseiarcus sp.]
MKILRFAGSQVHAAYALGVVFLGALALTALGSFVPDETLNALRSLIPGESPFLPLLLLGWTGVALGRLTIGAESNAAQRVGQSTTRRDPGPGEEKVERVLRHIAKVLQAHLTDSESFSERLDGANERLSRQQAVGPIKDIVLALIDDNRDMRDSFTTSGTSLKSRAFRSCSCKQTSNERKRRACATS